MFPNQILHKLHYRAGIVVAAFLLLLAISGVLLNHSHAFKLDQRFIGSSMVLSWYDLAAPEQTEGFEAEAAGFLLDLDQKLYLDGRFLGDLVAPMVGGIEWQQHLLVATPENLLLMTSSGELIERIVIADWVAGQVVAVGKTAAGLPVLRTQDGLFISSDEMISWHRTLESDVAWSMKSEVPAEQLVLAQEHYLAHLISVERLLLDLHSGGLLGMPGFLLLDLVAGLIVMLVLTGCYLGFKLRQRSRSVRSRY